MTNPTSPSPTHIGNILTVQPLHENGAIQNTAAPSLSPESHSSNNINEMEQMIISEETFVKKPSHWNKNDRRFQGVKTRRFIGSKEVPHSIFDDGIYYSFSSQKGMDRWTDHLCYS